MEENYLVHHGILGMRWGIRRYQNKDGSLTPAGKRHAAELAKEYNDLVDPTGEKRKAAEAAKAQQNAQQNNQQNSQQNAQQNNQQTQQNNHQSNQQNGQQNNQQNQNNQQKQNNNNNGNNNGNNNNNNNNGNNNNKYGNNDIELVDMEFRKKVATMKLQRDYLQAQSDIAKLTPKKVGKGEKFMKALGDIAKNPMVQPILKEVGSNITDTILTKAGLKQPPQKSQKDIWKDQHDTLKAKYDLESMAKKLYDEFGIGVSGTAAGDRASAAQNAASAVRKVHTYKVKKRAVQADSFSTSTSSSDPILHDYAQLGSTFIAGLLGPSTVDAYLPGKH